MRLKIYGMDERMDAHTIYNVFDGETVCRALSEEESLKRFRNTVPKIKTCMKRERGQRECPKRGK